MVHVPTGRPPYFCNVHHPSLRWWIFTAILLGLTVLFGFISVFVPWAWVDIGVGTRVWAYPFKSCIEDTYSTVNQETCLDNDFIEPEGAGVTGSHHLCDNLILTTIAFVFISVITGILTLILLAVIIDRIWSRPLILAGIAEFLLIFIFMACIITWALFIGYAETECEPDTFFPVKGYSYGFVLYIFNTFFMMAAVLTGGIAFSHTKNHKPFMLESEEMTSNIFGDVVPPAAPLASAPAYLPLPAMQPSYIPTPQVPTTPARVPNSPYILPNRPYISHGTGPYVVG